MAVNVAVAAITGGDIGKAAIAGVIQGVCLWAGGELIGGPVGQFIGATGGGALGAVATGGDPAMAAVSAGITFGIVQGLGGGFGVDIGASAELFSEQFFKELVITTAVGAGAGGVTATIMGGNFWDGALGGTIGASAGSVIGASLAEVMPEDTASVADPSAPDVVLQMCEFGDVDIEAYIVDPIVEELLHPLECLLDKIAAQDNVLFDSEMAGMIEILRDPKSLANTASGFWDKGVYPQYDKWLMHEGYVDNRYCVMGNEFTVHQNVAPAAAVYGWLCAEKQ